jgi:predicted alpha/beta superfamily hydrolase
MIVVGIGYPLDTIHETWAPRTRDYSPTDRREWYERMVSQASFPEYLGSGKAGDFLRFVREELMPEIHSDYRANPDDQAVVGHSGGGQFALYTLLHRPDSFERYVVSSPTIYFETLNLFEDEEEYASQNSDLDAAVFLSAGALEDAPVHVGGTSCVGNVLTLAETLEARQYPGLRLHAHVFDDETHVSVIPASFSRGLRAVHG